MADPHQTVAQALEEPRVETATAPPEPVFDEAAHLRHLIEKLPSCLMRVSLDGLVLAANEAALRLLGAGELRQVLGNMLVERISPDAQGHWRELAARAGTGACGSIECAVVDLSGTHRTVFVQSVPLLDHPDRIPSMLLTIRDTSVPRQLEKALEERHVKRQLDELQTEIEGALADRHGAVDEHAAESGRLQQALTAEQQRAAELTDQCERSLGEQRRLEGVLGDREAEWRRVADEHAAERTQLQRTLAAEEQLVAELRGQWERALAEQRRLEAVREEREAERQRVVAEHEAERARLKQTLVEEYQLELLLKEREGRQQLNDVRTDLEKTLAEEKRLGALLKERETDRQRLTAAYAAEREQAEQGLAAAAQNEQRLAKALADGQIELQSLQANLRRLESLAVAGRVALGVGRELHAVVAAVDARARSLLARCSLESVDRQEIERLRSDVISIAFLARQMVPTNVEAPAIPAEPSASGGAAQPGPSDDMPHAPASDETKRRT